MAIAKERTSAEAAIIAAFDKSTSPPQLPLPWHVTCGPAGAGPPVRSGGCRPLLLRVVVRRHPRLTKNLRQLGEVIGHLTLPGALKVIPISTTPRRALQPRRHRRNQVLHLRRLLIKRRRQLLNLFRNLPQETAHVRTLPSKICESKSYSDASRCCWALSAANWPAARNC